jgi:hypothetical protein
MPDELVDDVVGGAPPDEVADELAGVEEPLLELEFEPHAATPRLAITTRAVARRRAGLLRTFRIDCSLVSH